MPGSAPDVVESYRFAFAGFSAQMTSAQADALKKDPSVANVWKDTLQQPTAAAGDPDTALGGFHGDGASYLRLTDPNIGLWNQLGGPLAKNGAGSGVIVGDIDTGIQPNHPSFADKPKDGYIGDKYDPPAVWDGACQAGDGFPVTACNNKLIGARYYVDGFGRNNLDPKSHLSPRDDEGHGTHTASTAAGNYGVDPVIDGNDLGVDVISGISPRSYVAMYKVCWEGNGIAPRRLLDLGHRQGGRRRGRRRRRRHQLLGRLDRVAGARAPTGSPSSAPPTPASSSPTRPATPVRAPRRSARPAARRG